MEYSDYKINDIVKEFPHMYKITIYRTPKIITQKQQNNNKTKINNQNNDDNIQRSVRRTKTVIKDYVDYNEFNLFVTFTFSPKKVNRFDMNACYRKMSTWLHNIKVDYDDFAYLIVPEKHKNGAIHFHALFKNFPNDKLKKTTVFQNNKQVYNLTNFRSGFTNAQFIDDNKQSIAGYLTKYITKDMQKIHNRKRYWSSRNLSLPEKRYNVIYDLGLTRKISDLTEVFQNEYLTMHEIPKI